MPQESYNSITQTVCMKIFVNDNSQLLYPLEACLVHIMSTTTAKFKYIHTPRVFLIQKEHSLYHVAMFHQNL